MEQPVQVYTTVSATEQPNLSKVNTPPITRTPSDEEPLVVPEDVGAHQGEERKQEILRTEPGALQRH
jgi:hypothetical protein